MAKRASKSSAPQIRKRSAKKAVAVAPRASTEPRFCYHVPVDSFIPGYGYRVSIVVENQPGHRPTGHWPYDVRHPMPYFWGSNGERGRAQKWTLEAAEKQARIVNKRNLGLSENDVIEIITSSMRVSMELQRDDTEVHADGD